MAEEKKEKIVSLAGRPIAGLDESVPDVVELAEFILSEAKSGKLRAIAVTGIDVDGRSLAQFAGQTNSLTLFGAISKMKDDYYHTNLTRINS